MPLLWLSLAFLAGIGLASLANWSVLTWACLAVGTLLLLILKAVLARRFPQLPALTLRLPNPDGFPASHIPRFLILLSLFTGGLRYQMVQPSWDDGFIARYNDLQSEFILQGVVVQPADQRDRFTQLTVRVDKIRASDAAVDQLATGLLLARLSPGVAWRYGDRLSLHGELETPPEDEDFSYRDYLARQGVFAYMPSARATLLAPDQGNRLLAGLYSFRERALRSLYRIFPDPEASLLAGILLGIDTNIPEAVQQAFQDSGTSHIIAISGFNMAIVAGLFAALFGRLLGKRKGAAASIIAITLYTLLVGAGPSVVRAALMSGLSVFAAQVGRRGNGLNTLAITAALMAFFDPNVLWDVGFQLTFMATLGLVLYAGPLTEAFVRLAERFISNEHARRLSKPVGEYFLFTLAALVLTFPVTVAYFHRLPLSSLLANPLVLPAQPGVMVLGGLAMLLGMLSQPVGQIAAYLAWPFVAYTIHMAEFWAQFKNTIVSFGEVSSLAIMVFYALLFLLTFGLPAWRSRAQAAQVDQASPVEPCVGRLPAFKAWLSRYTAPLLSLTLVGLAIMTVLAWRAAAAAPDGRLHLTILDVGSGDALLIQTPAGRNLLIDGGASASVLSDALGRRLPLGLRRLDLLVVAGIENEQLEALPRTLEHYPAAQVLWSGPTGGTRGARLLREYLAKAKIPLTDAQTGQVIDLGEGARLSVLSANKRGAVLLMEWDNFRALLPISLDRAASEALQADSNLSSVTALLLSDGGYAPLNPPAWITKLNPQLILLSVAAGDRRNLPDAETLGALQGYPLLRTDQNGWIELTTDGQQMWVEVERK